MHAFSRQLLARELEEFDHIRKVLFALLCTDRTTPCLQKLELIKDDYHGAEIEAFLERIWGIVISDSLELCHEEIREMLSRCQSLIPDWDEQNYNWATQATYAVSATLYCLCLCLENSTQYAVNAANAVVECTYLYVVSSLGAKVHAMSMTERDAHHLLQMEFAKQESDIFELREIHTLTIDHISRLRIQNQRYWTKVAVD